MHNHLIKGVLTCTIALTVLGSESISAHAANWHKGTPTSLQGKWRTKWHVIDKGVSQGRELSNISRKNVVSLDVSKTKLKGHYNTVTDMGMPDAIGASYKYLGNHSYQIKGKDLAGTNTFNVYRGIL